MKHLPLSSLRPKLCVILFIFGFLLPAPVFPDSPVPASLQPPADETLLLSVHARGDQIYVCKAAKWVLEAPDATLYDASGAEVGKHFAGPAWKYADQSQVNGKLIASSPAPGGDAIPWLLLTAASHTSDGRLSAVQHIQRLRTQGGLAPTAGCDSAREGTHARISYEADYAFWVHPAAGTHSDAQPAR